MCVYLLVDDQATIRVKPVTETLTQFLSGKLSILAIFVVKCNYECILFSNLILNKSSVLLSLNQW